ncbi:hypothetical protein EYC45_03015 [Pseudoxanthomonas winnipegensis]|nr:hypothetical protein EYC45_03015 [Pseudoxanthomonas winnipegensis]
MDVMAWAQQLEASALGQWMRAGWGYPFANVLHLGGLVLLLGSIGLLDLRLLGFGRRLELEQVSRLLTPLGIVGLLVLVVTGVMLFSADATALLGNRMMQFKLIAVAVAVINALAFRLCFGGRLHAWRHRPPPLGRAMAALSLLAWPIMLVAGRMIAYT